MMEKEVLNKYGIQIIENFDFNNIKPSSSFVVFNLNNGQKQQFIEKINDETFLERLPYRLFVVDNEQKIASNYSNFLKKRLCIISNADYNKLSELLRKSDPRSAVVYLYQLWIKHLCRLCNCNKSNFEVLIYTGTESGAVTIPDEVFNKYKVIQKLYEASVGKDENDKSSKDEFVKVKHSKNSNDLSQCNNKIIYCRHHQRVENAFYYEAFSGDSVSFPIYFWWPETEIEKKLRACLLVENALLELVVVDERVAERVMWNPNYFSLFHFYPVEIVKGDNEIKLNEKGLEKRNNQTYAYKLYLNNEIKLVELEKKNNNIEGKEIKFTRTPILLIHQGVLDKIFKENSKEKLAERISKIKEKFPFVVITSGRGKPSNTPENTKFILLSDILANIRKSDYPDKLGIINILFSISGG